MKFSHWLVASVENYSISVHVFLFTPFLWRETKFFTRQIYVQEQREYFSKPFQSKTAHSGMNKHISIPFVFESVRFFIIFWKMDGTNTSEMDIELPIFVPTESILVHKQYNECFPYSLLRVV